MQVSGWLLGTFVLVAVAVVVATRWMSKRNTLSRRNSISLADMYQQDMTATGASLEVFEKVLNVLGQAYDIDPGKLRSSDKLKIFYDLDSWDLGEGTEKLNNRLIEEFGVMKFEVEPQSIRELVVEIGRQIKAV